MEYNSSRSIMSISEYGRNVYKMVDFMMGVEDREKRNRLAKATINVMAQLNPHLKDYNDFKQKLWDHLFIISDFKLDVDSPYPKPEPEHVFRKPLPVGYPQNNIKYKHYGRYIQVMVEKASKMEDSPERQAFVKLIANHMKKAYLTWNRESVSDEDIAKHLLLISNGKLELSDNVKLFNAQEILAKNKKKKFVPKQNYGKQGYHKQRKV